MKQVTLGEVEQLCHKLTQETMAWDEPIPPIATRFPGKLESCLLAPFQTYGGKRLYRGLLGTAAILFYLLVKNHPFQNGNKRIAVTTLLWFLYKNGKWLKISNQELYNFAIWVAESSPTVKTETVAAIETFFRKALVNRPE